MLLWYKDCIYSTVRHAFQASMHPRPINYQTNKEYILKVWPRTHLQNQGLGPTQGWKCRDESLPNSRITAIDHLRQKDDIWSPRCMLVLLQLSCLLCQLSFQLRHSFSLTPRQEQSLRSVPSLCVLISFCIYGKVHQGTTRSLIDVNLALVNMICRRLVWQAEKLLNVWLSDLSSLSQAHDQASWKPSMYFFKASYRTCTPPIPHVL